jgi:hypothetical protein
LIFYAELYAFKLTSVAYLCTFYSLFSINTFVSQTCLAQSCSREQNTGTDEYYQVRINGEQAAPPRPHLKKIFEIDRDKFLKLEKQL